MRLRVILMTKRIVRFKRVAKQAMVASMEAIANAYLLGL